MHNLFVLKAAWSLFAENIFQEFNTIKKVKDTKLPPSPFDGQTGLLRIKQTGTYILEHVVEARNEPKLTNCPLFEPKGVE